MFGIKRIKRRDLFMIMHYLVDNYNTTQERYFSSDDINLYADMLTNYMINVEYKNIDYSKWFMNNKFSFYKSNEMDWLDLDNIIFEKNKVCLRESCPVSKLKYYIIIKK